MTSKAASSLVSYIDAEHLSFTSPANFEFTFVNDVDIIRWVSLRIDKLISSILVEIEGQNEAFNLNFGPMRQEWYLPEKLDLGLSVSLLESF